MTQTNNMILDVKDLRATVNDIPILKGVNLQVKKGEIHAIMGPNGSGKSTFSKVIAGHPSYTQTGGERLIIDIDLLLLFSIFYSKISEAYVITDSLYSSFIKYLLSFI